MKITKKQIRRIIREELETLAYEEQVISAEQEEDAALAKEKAEDIEAVPDAWAGGSNLVHSMDHSKAIDSDPVTRGQEVSKLTEKSKRRKLREVRLPAHGIFDSDHLADILRSEVEDYINQERPGEWQMGGGLEWDEWESFSKAIQNALQNLNGELK